MFIQACNRSYFLVSFFAIYVPSWLLCLVVTDTIFVTGQITYIYIYICLKLGYFNRFRNYATGCTTEDS
jgi:hypothetical protein